MIPSTSQARFERAKQSIEGLSVGDALGDRWFFTRRDIQLFQPIEDRTLPPRPWEYTDDTHMALSIVEILRSYNGIEQDQLAQSFARRFERQRGYGPAMYQLLPQLLISNSWQILSKSLFRGEGSFGNGGAMRVAPLGAYFADDLALVVEHAQRSAEVTHAHPEGIAGAIAIAVAAAFAWQYQNQRAEPHIETFFENVLAYVPESKVKEGVRKAQLIPADATVRDAVSVLGNGSGVTAQDTVAFTLWCASTHLNNYEEAIWLTLSGGGDYDTNCAIVGGIVVMYTGIEGIPQSWLRNREALPDWPFTNADS